jgi:anti-sigma B factor antagonist
MNSPGPREPTDSLTVTITLTEGMVAVGLCGEVDVANHDQLRAALARAEVRTARVVWVDLSRLTFCDSTGCMALLRFEKHASAAGHEIRMLGAAPTIIKVMRILAEESHV